MIEGNQVAISGQKQSGSARFRCTISCECGVEFRHTNTFAESEMQIALAAIRGPVPYGIAACPACLAQGRLSRAEVIFERLLLH